MSLVNLTPHPIVLVSDGGARRTIPPSGTVARVGTTPGEHLLDYTVEVGSPVPILAPDEWGDVEDLPEPQEGVAYIVSALVGLAMEGSDRTDLVMPGTAPADNPERDAQGRITGVRVLKAVPWGDEDEDEEDDDDRAEVLLYPAATVPPLSDIEEVLEGAAFEYHFDRMEAAVLARVAPGFEPEGELDAPACHALLVLLVKAYRGGNQRAGKMAESILAPLNMEWI